MVLINETSRNESSFLQDLSLLWPVWQSRAAVGPNLSLSQAPYQVDMKNVVELVFLSISML